MSENKALFSLTNIYPLLLAVVPLIYITSLPDPAETPVYLVLGLFSLLFILSIFRRAAEGAVLTDSYRVLWLLLMALLSVGVISAIVNRTGTETLYELCRTGSLLLFVYAHVVYIMLAGGAWRKLVYGLALMAACYLCIGLYEAWHLGAEFMEMETSYELRAHLGHRNLMAIFYVLSLPLYTYIYLSATRPAIRYAAALAALVTVVFVTLVASRVGWLGLLSYGCVIAARAISHYRRRPWRQAIPALSMLLLVVAIIAGTVLTHRHSLKNFRQKLEAFTKIHQEVDPNTYTINERLELWHMSVSMAARNPILGVGPGMWGMHYAEGGIHGTQAQSGKVLFQRPHNDLLWYLCEYGIGGLLAFVMMIAFVSWYSYRAIRSAQREEAYLALSGIIIFMVCCEFDFPKERPVHLFMLSFYLAVFAARVPFSAVRLRMVMIRDRYMVLMASLLAVLLCLYFGIRTSGEYDLNQALAYRSVRAYPAMRRAISETEAHLMHYYMTGTPLEFYLGEASFYEGDASGAISHFEQSLRQNPYHLYSLSNMGSCYWVLGRRDQALATWDSALHISPTFGEGRINKSIALFQSGDTIGAAANLCYPMLVEDIDTYRHQIIIIFGSRVISAALSIGDTLVQHRMLDLAQRDKWIMHLYRQMIRDKSTPAHTALEQTLWVLEKLDRRISADQKMSLLQKYDNRFR
jgi:O-antigen ligase